MLVAMPSKPVAANIDWRIAQPAQVNRSEVTSKRRVVLLGEAPRWSATVTMPAIIGERNVETWRAFVVDLDGVANTFKLIACENDQISGVAPFVKGAGQAGFSLLTGGWGAAGPKLRRGQFVTINDQLLMLMAPVIADANGNATISYKAYVRISPANNALLEVKRPYSLMAMKDPTNGWQAGIGQKYGIQFECEEP